MPSLHTGIAQSRPAPSGRLLAAIGDTLAAERIAQVWPSPHAAFFELDAPRRNVLRLAARRAMLDVDLARQAEGWALRRLVDALIPDAPDGLAEALRKLGDQSINMATLKALVEILSDDGAKALRHCQRLNARIVQVLKALPKSLRRPRILALVETPNAAQLVTAGLNLYVKHGKAGGDEYRMAQRLERARSLQNLFRMLVEEIGIEVLSPAPIPGTSWLRPIDTSARIRDAALRFRNCLETRIGWMLKGHAAYYEVLGNEPAIVELLRHPQQGWMLGEALGHANTPLSADLRQQIRTYVTQQGAITKRTAFLHSVAERLAVAAGW
ncbi:MAG: hypothetical protein CME88_13935 [Hirschia sp.]|nr:hypothetical protein [Hirschia sp.]MBF19472.1 hypothetical protein [Hirschia sp.]|tara:strand:+ start:3576 stop:4553 length:978 start_codon:yes stop_codon:yes gene_type:complete